MKKLLVLGGGISQLDLIERAKKLGLSVYVCGGSILENIKDIADGYRILDIREVVEVENYAQEINANFLFTVGLEMALPIIETVSTNLSLPQFFYNECLTKFSDKGTWRKVLGDIEGNVKYKEGTSLEDFSDWKKFPAIIKPVDGSGQRGVYKVNSFSDIAQVIKDSLKFSKKNKLIIEEFIGGSEISVNTFVEDGSVKFIIPSDRISYSNYPGGIIKEHHIPTKVEVDYKKLEKLITDVITKMSINNGHIYFQIKVENKIPKLIEFTPRFDGCHMWRLITIATGVNLLDWAIEWLMGKRHMKVEKSKIESIYKTKFISDKPGTLVKQEKYSVERNPLYKQWYYNNGDMVKTVTGYLEKVGYVIVEEKL